MAKEENAVVSTLEDDSIKSRILTIRGVQVMLDRDLAELYGVPTKRLNEQVKRNSIRFPANFMFPLSDAEIQDIFISGSDIPDRSRSQIATLNKGRGHNIKYRPNVFTEHGIIMLASVLKSEIAALVSIRITNTFVEMRKALSSIAPLLARIKATDRRQIADQIRNDANQVRNEERFKPQLTKEVARTFAVLSPSSSPASPWVHFHAFTALDSIGPCVRLPVEGNSCQGRFACSRYRPAWCAKMLL